MSWPDRLRLRDIREAIATVRRRVAGGGFDRKTSDAVINNLVVTGEAAAPEVFWPRIVALRNLLTHEYSAPISTSLRPSSTDHSISSTP